DLGGMIDGEARITGTGDAPDANFTLNAEAITAAALRQAGQSPLTVRATGNTTAQRLDVDATVTSPEGLRAAAIGAVPLDYGSLALDIDLAAFPPAALNRAVPGQDLGGTVTGSSLVEGTLAAPRANFNLRGAGLAGAPLRSAGM